jgi:hypothetical protein
MDLKLRELEVDGTGCRSCLMNRLLVLDAESLVSANRVVVDTIVVCIVYSASRQM